MRGSWVPPARRERDGRPKHGVSQHIPQGPGARVCFPDCRGAGLGVQCEDEPGPEQEPPALGPESRCLVAAKARRPRWAGVGAWTRSLSFLLGSLGPLCGPQEGGGWAPPSSPRASLPLPLPQCTLVMPCCSLPGVGLCTVTS